MSGVKGVHSTCPRVKGALGKSMCPPPGISNLSLFGVLGSFALIGAPKWRDVLHLLVWLEEMDHAISSILSPEASSVPSPQSDHSE